MPIFQFEAYDLLGKLTRGSVEADSERDARNQLRQQQMTPLKVVLLDNEAQISSSWQMFGHRLSHAELTMLTFQMATLLQAGLNIVQTLSAMLEQCEDKTTAAVLSAMRADVQAGQSLSAAMSRFARSFPEIYRAIVQAGEASGQLSRVMQGLALYTESRQTLAQNIQSATVYPILVALVAISVISGLLIYVVPQVAEVFQQSHQTLPLLTRLLIGLSQSLQLTWPYLFALLLLCTGLGWYGLQQPHIRFRWHLTLLKLPLFGALIRSFNTARFAHALGIMLGSGVPIIQALTAASRTLANLPMRQALEQATTLVHDGMPLSQALKLQQIFPPILYHLIANAEATGQLDQMLQRTAEQQSKMVEHQVTTMTNLLEPAMILLMGLVVLLIVLAILLPMLEMQQLIR